MDKKAIDLTKALTEINKIISNLLAKEPGKLEMIVLHSEMKLHSHAIADMIIQERSGIND